MTASAAALIAWARDQIGTTEHPADSNRVRYWDDVGMPGANGAPWCAAFYLAGLLAVGVAPVTRSVYVPTITVDYRHARRLFPIDQALPGDQVLYNIGKGHTGVVVSVDRTARTVTAIEGNTSAGTAGSQDNGGGVYQRTRRWSTVTGVGRPPFAQEIAVPKHNPPLTLEPVVFDMACPSGGAWLLAASGAVYAVGGAPFRQWLTRATDFAGRVADHLELPDPARGEAKDGHAYVIVSTDGRRYVP